MNLLQILVECRNATHNKYRPIVELNLDVVPWKLAKPTPLEAQHCNRLFIVGKEASKKIGAKIEPQSLYNKFKRVYLLPNKYTSIIKKIMAIDENDWPL